MALVASGEGPNGFSLESSLMSVVKSVRCGHGRTLSVSTGRAHKTLGSSAGTVLGGGLQPSHFLRGQVAKFPGKNVKLQRPIAYPLDLLHMMPDGFEHLPDL